MSNGSGSLSSMALSGVSGVSGVSGSASSSRVAFNNDLDGILRIVLKSDWKDLIMRLNN